MRYAVQTSESMELGFLLALSGGFMDAYSYIERGKVFANAQTGNMLLMGVNLAEKKYSAALQYLFPVLAFAVGITLADLIRSRTVTLLHWRQAAVITEAIILFLVSFFPQSLNLPANAFTSLACGIQVEAFRKIHGNSIATTMCIGNLRGGTHNLYEYFHTKNKTRLENSLIYYSIILFFILGAVIGNFMIKIFHERAILGCFAMLLLVFCFMFIDREKPKSNPRRKQRGI